MKRLGFLLLVACSKHRVPLDHSLFDEVVIDTPPGVSDLAIDPHGTLWAIPERNRELDEIAFPAATVTHHPLDGIPDGIDTESLAWLGEGRFALGTEGATEPTAGVTFVERRGDRFVATRTRPLTSAEVGVPLEVNKGAEGICGHDQTVLVAIETVGRLADGTRWAPLAWLVDDHVTVTKLRLTTATGKISALDCHFAPDGSADIIAIERHFHVAKILSFHATFGAAEITPTVVLDLAAVLHNTLNLEGIVRLADGRMVVVNDNQSTTVEGPSELLVFHPL